MHVLCRKEIRQTQQQHQTTSSFHHIIHIYIIIPVSYTHLDIHFNPKVADVAAQYVEKVRINPGNYVDAARTFKHLEYRCV